MHCGREVLPERAEPAGITASTASLLSHSHDCLGGGIQGDLTYSESLSVAWLLIWRGSIITAAISLVTGLAVWSYAIRGSAAIESLGVILSLLPTLLLGVFVVMPWLIRTMLKKRFRSFSLVVLREQEGSDN